jgi:glycerophosphoryl diester phosphodiesterase
MIWHSNLNNGIFLFLMFLPTFINTVMVIGHRGACGYEPENTLRSFAKAIELGAHMIECDVHVCLSGELVVIHDDTVDATTNGIGFIAEKTLAELYQLDAGKGERIPTLRQVLDLIDRRVLIDIELKGKGSGVLVAQLVDEYVSYKGWRYSDFFVTSFDDHELSLFTQLCQHVSASHIIHTFDGAWRTILERIDTPIFITCSREVTLPMVEYLHGREIRIYVYTVNEFTELQRMQELAVDGIFSDYPDRVFAVFE